jgi:hypothetical protein
VLVSVVALFWLAALVVVELLAPQPAIATATTTGTPATLKILIGRFGDLVRAAWIGDIRPPRVCVETVRRC